MMSKIGQKPAILRARVALLAPLLALSSMACVGTAQLAAPDKDRTSPTPYPDIPEGEAPCLNDPVSRCLSDAQNASLLRAYDAALTRANEKLQWLADYLASLLK